MLYGDLVTTDYLACIELSASFDDGSSSAGSGIIIGETNSLFVCTARHVMDPRYRPRNDGFRDTRIIECRAMIRVHKMAGTTLEYQPFEITFRNPELIIDERDNDVCAIKVPKTQIELHNGFELTHFKLEDLANAAQIAEYSASAPAFIIGYPSTAPNGQQMSSGRFERLPVVRQGILATIPAVMNEVPNILGSEYGYLDCYALNGFSGGPVLVPQFGIEKKPGRLISSEIYRPTRIIGILSGHLRSSDDRADGRHTGLSYYCSSQTLLRLLKKHQ